MNKKKFLNKLLAEDNKLINEVVEDLDYYDSLEEIKSYLEDILNYGCVSGIVSKLVYYKDTNKFYDTYEEEIEDLIDEFKKEMGYNKRAEFIASLNGSSESMTQEKNLLSWFAYEETARRILDRLEEEKV